MNDTHAARPAPADDDARAPWLLLRGGAVPGLAVGLAVCAAGGVLAGGAGALGAAVGTALSVTALATGPLLLRAARNTRPAVLFALAVTTYAVVVGVLGVSFLVLDDVPQLNGRWLGGAVTGCTAAWLAGQARQTSRLRLLAFGDRPPPG